MSPFFVSSLPTRVTSHLSQHFVNQLNNLQLDSWTFWISQKVKLIKFDKKQIKTDYLCPSLHLSPYKSRAEYFSIYFRGESFPGENIFQRWIFIRGEYFSGLNICQRKIFVRGEYFRWWIFFQGVNILCFSRAEYFSGWIFLGLNTFQGWIFFKIEYFSEVNIF